MATSFVAYPSLPVEIGTTIKSALRIIEEERPGSEFRGWEENDIAGRFITDPILTEIEDAELLSADITRLNFNVTYEIGYAIGKLRRVVLVKNGSLASDDALIREIGLFDTLGYKSYSTSRQLVGLLTSVSDLAPLPLDEPSVSHKAPIFVVLPRTMTDTETQLVSRIKKAFRLPYRSFDPEEHGRLSAQFAIKHVAISYGVVVPLLSQARIDAQVHNMRAAFVAGLANGMGKELLLLQYGDGPVPLDYRDLVKLVPSERHLEAHFSEFAPEVFARYSSDVSPARVGPQSLLQKLNLGASSAENEMGQLPDYYLETEEYRRVVHGETQIVTGRKGSGKTALFVSLRAAVRRNRQNVVLDLRPEGFQLLRFKDLVLQHLEQGTKEHTITAFWEYLLLLEICHKLLEKDREPHLTNHTLYEPYRALAKEYGADAYVSEGDFAERMLKLMLRITNEFKDVIGTGEWRARLSSHELTNILYQHDTKRLRDMVSGYLSNKREMWILFDNLDKGWPATGIGADDVLIVRCLIDAIGKLQKYFRKAKITCNGVVFLRNDVYEILIDNTPDRGKSGRAILDWTDPEMLREVLRLRFVSSAFSEEATFDQIWPQVCVSHIGAEDSSTYLLDRSLMRPRSLIDFLQYCRSHALNLKHELIETADVHEGEKSYSSELVANIGFEIRDVFPAAGDVLYEFVGFSKKLSYEAVANAFVNSLIGPELHDQMLELLLWYGFLGVIRDNGEVAYIYNVNYDKKRLKALMKRDPASHTFFINPAFWLGLEIV